MSIPPARTPSFTGRAASAATTRKARSEMRKTPLKSAQRRTPVDGIDKPPACPPGPQENKSRRSGQMMGYQNRTTSFAIDRDFRFLRPPQSKSGSLVADNGAGFKTPLARRSNRRPIDHRSPRRLRPALHLYPDRKSSNRRPGSGAPKRWGSDGDARLLDRSTKLSPNRGLGRRLSIGRERMPGPRPTLRGSQSNPSCRFPRYALSNLTPTDAFALIENREHSGLPLPHRHR